MHFLFEGVVTTECSLYSIGDGVIYQHRPSRLDQPAEDINAIIRRTNNSKARSLNCFL